MAVTRIGFWIWIWSTRHCGVGQEGACWFQVWKNSTGFVWLVCWHWCYWYENGWGSALEEKLSFKMLGLTFSSKLDWGFYIISIAKPATKKIGAFICSMKFLYFFKSTIRSARNTFVMSGLVLLAATGNYWISYRNGCARLLVLHLLSNLNSWLIVEL